MRSDGVCDFSVPYIVLESRLESRLVFVNIVLDGQTGDGRADTILSGSKHPREYRVSRGGRSLGGGDTPAAPRGSPDISPRLQQRDSRLRLTPPPRPYQRREPVLVGAVHVAPRVHDGADPSRITLLSGGDESLRALGPRRANTQSSARAGTHAREPVLTATVLGIPAAFQSRHHWGEQPPSCLGLRRDRLWVPGVQPRQVLVVCIVLVENLHFAT